MNIEKIKAWATTDDKGNVIFKLVKLSFDSFQR